MSNDIQDEINEIVEETKASFDLGARLRGRSARTKSVRVFTDEVTGERLGGAEVVREVNAYGIPAMVPRTWGLMGEIINLRTSEDPDLDQIASLEDEVKTLAAKLEKSALDIELRAVPPVIKKDARRAAKDALGIKGKTAEGDPRHEELLDEQDAQTLQRTVVTIRDAETNVTQKGISIDDARALKDYLPEWEYLKLQNALTDLLWRNAIAEKATEDPDFSLGI